MGWRNISSNNVFIGNFLFVAGIGMVVSEQWEIVLGNSYAYTVLSAFGLFYGGFGAIISPAFGVRDTYGNDIASYNNALGFWVLSKSSATTIFQPLMRTVWAVWNLFFLIGSLPINLVYAGIFLFVQLAFTLIAASYFAAADGHAERAIALQRAGGVFAFLAGLLGYYTVGNLMCQDALNFRFPMGDTSRYFTKSKEVGEKRELDASS